jgi:hypothetical protein
MSIIPLFGLVVGMLILLTVQIFFYRKARRRQNWNSTKGKILTSTLTREPLDRTPLWYPSIRYSYRVGGKTYHNTKLGTGNRYTDLPTAQKEIEQYPVGAEITVYYDPQHPDKPIVKRKSSEINLGIMIGILVLSLIFILLFALKLLEIYYRKA